MKRKEKIRKIAIILVYIILLNSILYNGLDKVYATNTINDGMQPEMIDELVALSDVSQNNQTEKYTITWNPEEIDGEVRGDIEIIDENGKVISWEDNQTKNIDSETIVITINPDVGYELGAFRVDNQVVNVTFDDETEEYRYTLSGINKDIEISATFVRKNNVCVVTWMPEEISGKIRGDVIVTDWEGRILDWENNQLEVAGGESLIFIFEADENYDLTELEVDNELISLNSLNKDSNGNYLYRIYVVNNDISLRAKFTSQTQSRTIKVASDTNKGEVKAYNNLGTQLAIYDGEILVDNGDYIKFVFDSDASNCLSQLKVNSQTITPDLNGVRFDSETGNYEYEISSVTRDITISAEFTEIREVNWSTTRLENLLSSNNTVFIDSSNNCCYAREDVILERDDHTYRLENDGKYGRESFGNKEVIEKFYQRPTNPSSFGEERLIKIITPITVVIDNQQPTVSDCDCWSNQYQQITLAGTILEENFDAIYWSKESLVDQNGNISFPEAHNYKKMNASFTGVNNTYTFKQAGFTLKEGESLYVCAVDKAGNANQMVFEKNNGTIELDETAPEIVNIYVTENKLISNSKGNFTNEEIQVTISGNDAGAGLNTIEVYAKSNPEKRYKAIYDSENQVYFAQITSNEGEEKPFEQLDEIAIELIDQAGNAREVVLVASDEEVLEGSYPFKVKTDNDQYKIVQSSLFMIDRESPTASVAIENVQGTIKEVNGERQVWYKEIGENLRYWVDDRWVISGESENGEESTQAQGSGIGYYKVFINDDHPIIFMDYRSGLIVEQACGGYIPESSNSLKPGRNVIRVEVEDLVGNLGSLDEDYVFYLDDKDPEVTGFSIDENTNKLEYGNFSNDTVMITVTAMDAAADGDVTVASGVREVILYVGDIELQGKEVDENGQATFEVTIDQFNDMQIKPITAKAIDWSGRESKTVAINQGEVSLNILSDLLLIENMNPNANFDYNNDSIHVINGKRFVGESFTLSVSVNDLQSGLQSAYVDVVDDSQKPIRVTEKSYVREQAVTEDKFSFDITSVSGGDFSSNNYRFKIVVTDNAGNTCIDNDAQINVYRDVTGPRVTKFVMHAGESQVEAQANIIKDEEYGYFFSQDTKVWIYVSDGPIESSSGIEEIRCYTIDYTGKKEERAVGAIIKADDADSYYAEVDIEAGFKGHIYANACDYMKNEPKGFVSTKGVVVETRTIHDAVDHIAISPDSSSETDSDGNPLYSGDTNVQITVWDTMSGIAEIEWTVEGAYDSGNNQSETVSFSKSVVEGDIVDGWVVIKNDNNLATEVQKTIQVSNNSNDILITVTMRDNAGNESTKDTVISIDKTIPVIDLSFDNNSPDLEYDNIYNNNRTATITVKERNFRADNIQVNITNEDGSIPEISGWETQINDSNPDETISTARVTFSQDGDYTMEISGQDAANHAADTISAEPFTIDKTMPKISITYNNNNVLNGSYYSTARTANISITEHNFAADRVTLTGVVAGAGEGRTFPLMSDFRQNGDVYTATVLCDEDGLYSFEVEYADKAGNTGEKYISESFCIDQTAPEIVILGVEPFSANNKDVEPVVTMTDFNYDSKGVDIELVGANRGVLTPEGSFVDIQNGEIYTFSNFPEESEYDDLYTITVSLTDLAGNQTTKDITFSVNRFGSVYVFDNSLKAIAGTYIQKEMDVKLTEINIDTLKHDSIKLVVDVNGTARDLEENVDYIVNESGGNGTWYRYDYTIYSSVFEGDGRYIVTVYSEDEAGNVNQNIDESKKAEISFGVDKTAPVVIPIDIESDTQYPVDVKTATIAVNDNLVLGSVDIYIGNVKSEYEVNGENYTFNIPSADSKQTIIIVAKDLAGNANSYEIKNVLVTTNWFIRWYNNKPLFVGSILGAVAVSGMGIGLSLFFRKRKY